MSKEIEKMISSVMKSANDTYNSINDYVIQLDATKLAMYLLSNYNSTSD